MHVIPPGLCPTIFSNGFNWKRIFLLILILEIVGISSVSAAAIPGVIGFRWNTSDSSPRLYQIDSDGTVIPNATGDWFNTHPPWSGMKTVVVNASNSTPVLYGTNNRGDGLDLNGTYGDVMVEIPKFYTCSTYSNGNFSYWISPDPQDALHYTVAPMFNQRGAGTEAGTAAAYYYIGRYDANLVGSKLQSATGKTPNVDMTLGSARTYAENKGAGWGITNVWTLSALRQLFYTEMVTLDSQTAWTGSRGIVDTGSSTPSNSGADGIDAAIYPINATGNGTGPYGKTPVSYRGIENLWGNVWQFQDGFSATTTGSDVINATGLGLTGQATTFAIPLGVNDNQSVGALPAEGWQIHLMNTDGARPLFLPSSVGGSDATYLSDYYYAPRSESAASPNILQSGGYCDDAGKAGVGALAPSDIASYTYAVVGARLEFRRILVPEVSFSSRNTSVATNTTSKGWAGVAPFSMVFNDTSTGTPISWVWSATNVTGNNEPFYINTTTVTLANISYEFKTAGNYTIKLNATNTLGSGISTQVTWVNVSAVTGPPPVASFSSRNTTVATNTTSQGWAGVSPFTMQFTDTSSNTPTSWKWARNNLTSTAWTVFNTSQNAQDRFWVGNWSVNLTATNTGGSGISSQTLWVNVSQATPAVTGITPSSGQNTTGVSITNLAGTGFYGTPTVNLTRAGYGNITASGVTVVSDSKLTCTFDLTNRIPGTWNVNVTNPDGQQAALLNGFEITNSSVPTPTPTPTPNPTPTSSGGGDVGSVQRQQSASSGSGVSIANGAPAGQTVTYSFGEPVTDYPVSIESIAFVPDQSVGQSQCLVTRSSPVAGFTIPDRPAVYESIQINWINPNVMSEATIQFSVKGSWMREHNVGPQGIVMMRQHDLVWAEIPTVYDHVANDIYYFRSTTPGFSNFAVSIRKNVTAVEGANVTTIPTQSQTMTNIAATTTPGSTKTSNQVLRTSMTPTPVPVPATKPEPGIPVLYVIAGIVIIILAVAGFFIGRRWWIRRQNPALFRKYD